MGIVQVIIDRSANETYEGVKEFDRASGGVLIPPQGSSFPASPVAGEWFWRTDENKLYRRNTANSAWESVVSTVVPHASSHATAGSDPINISESQVTNLTTDLAAKANASRQIATSNGLQGGGDLSADRTLSPVYGSTANTVCQGNDARLSNSRPPTAHAPTHGIDGDDAVTVAESQVTGLTAGLAACEKTANKNVANGYAGLNSSSKLNGAQQTYGSAANTACEGNDARLSDARAPTAHRTRHEPGGDDALTVDAVAGTGSLRTLGSGAQQACAGNDARLSNARTPTAHAATHAAAGSDPLIVAQSQVTNLTTDLAACEKTANKNQPSGYAGLDASSKLSGAQQTYGSAANTACQGNDARLSNARTPTAHAATHKGGGSDAIDVATTSLAGLMSSTDKAKLDTLRGWPFASVLTVDQTDPDANYSTIQAAINAASSGTVILVAPGTYAEKLTLKDGVTLIGMGSSYRGGSQVVVQVTDSSGFDLVTKNSAGTAFIENISFLALLNAAGTVNALNNISGGLRLKNCLFQAFSTASAGVEVVRGVTNAALIYAVGCSFAGADSPERNTQVSAVVTSGTFDATDCLFQVGSNTSTEGAFFSTGGNSFLEGAKLSMGTSGQPIKRTGGVVTFRGAPSSILSGTETDDADDTASASNFPKSHYGVMLTNGQNRAYKLPCRSLAADPAAPVNGDIWYNSATGKLRVRQNGVTSDLTSSGGGGTPGGADTQVQFNDGGAFGGSSELVWNKTGKELGLDGDLLLSSIAAPAAPAAGKMKLFARESAGRIVPAVRGPSGVTFPLQAGLFAQSVCMILPQTGSSISLWGIGYTGAGTVSHPTLANTNLLTQMRRARFASATTAGSFAGLRGSAAFLWRGNAAGLGGFMVGFRFAMTTNLSGVRAFVGLYASTSALTNADPSTRSNIIGMALDASDANWQIIRASGSSTAVKTDLGASFVKSVTDVYELRLFCAPNSSSISYSVENLSTGATTSGTLTTDLPANTVFLNPYLWITNNAQASAAQIELNRFYAESDT